MRYLVAITTSLLLGASGLAGCAGQQEMLSPVPREQIVEIDLTGTWLMLDDIGAMESRIQQAVRQTDGIDERDVLRGMMAADPDPRRRRRSTKVGGLVYVFLENSG